MLRRISSLLMLLIGSLATAQFAPAIIISEDLLQPVAPVIVDLDGDGDPDILTASMPDSALVWFSNDGTGMFSAPIVIDEHLSLYWADRTGPVVFDIDLDGDQDVLRPVLNEVLSWENLGAGQFAAPVPVIATTLTSLIVMDINGDPFPDMLGIEDQSAAFIAYINNGLGGFVADTLPYAPGPGPIFPVAHDVDGDGDQDVLFSEVDKDLHWFENLGNGTFAADTVLTTAPGIPTGELRCFTIGDVDADLDQDLITSVSPSPHQTTVLLNDGLDVFAPSQLLSQWPEQGLLLNDVDGDQDPDMLYLNGEFIGWRANDGAGVFGPVDTLFFYCQSVCVGLVFSELSIADLNADLVPDMLVTYWTYHPPPFQPMTIAWLPGVPLDLGVREGNSNTIAVFPDPFSDHARIKVNSPVVEVDVLDVNGRVLRSIPGNGTNELRIERGDLSQGLYVVRVVQDNGATVTGRVVVE